MDITRTSSGAADPTGGLNTGGGGGGRGGPGKGGGEARGDGLVARQSQNDS